jgi:hypothetical protein
MNKNLMVFLLLFIKTNISFAGQAVLWISIDKAGVSSKNIQKAVANLNYQKSTSGKCFVVTNVKQYLPWPFPKDDIPYHGTVYVDLNWECNDLARILINDIEKDDRYTIWASPDLEPSPAVSGGN